MNSNRARVNSPAVSEPTSDRQVGLLHEFLLEGLPAARAGVEAARHPRASGAARDPEALRTAYLDLLKLCLCDLAGTTTVSVGAMPGGEVASEELRGERLRLRSAGMDWPLQGLTMVGLGRLDDLQACVEAIVRENVPGDLIEVGAWRGGASILMRATLDSLGEHDRTVHVADSFEGFPSSGGEHEDGLDLSAYDFLAAPLDEVKENFARLGYENGVRFVAGFFDDTLPALADGRWALVRLDGDTYEATHAALRWLYPGLATGGYLIVDDYGAFEGCRRAVDEFRREHEIEEPLEEVGYPSVRWRRADAPQAPPPAAAGPRMKQGGSAGGAGRRRRDQTVPTVRELDLEREVANLRSRLAAAEADARRMGRSPLRASAARLRRRLLRRGAGSGAR
jgi:O-methyltransferase